MTNGESLFHGLPPSVEDYKPTRYCECEQGVEGATVSLCGYAIDVNNCDVYEGNYYLDIYNLTVIWSTQLLTTSVTRCVARID